MIYASLLRKGEPHTTHDNEFDQACASQENAIRGFVARLLSWILSKEKPECPRREQRIPNSEAPREGGTVTLPFV